MRRETYYPAKACVHVHVWKFPENLPKFSVNNIECTHPRVRLMEYLCSVTEMSKCIVNASARREANAICRGWSSALFDYDIEFAEDEQMPDVDTPPVAGLLILGSGGCR